MKTFKWAFAIVFLVLFYLFFSREVIFYAVVDGNSMEPTYHNSDIVPMTKLSLWFHGPHRGDVVLIREFNDFGKGDGKIDIKRVMGVKGDIVVKNDDGFIYQHQLKNNEYYVLGDNTNQGASFDSRFYGWLPRKQILGVEWK